MDEPQPTLTTDRLVLRPFTPADAPDVQRLAGDPLVAETTLAIPHPYPDGLAEEWISKHAPSYAAGAEATFAITRREKDSIVGAISLRLITPAHARAELGYWVARMHWGEGFATEAAREIVAYGFDRLGLHRIQAHTLTRNTASARVLEKAGMQLEGVRRGAVRTRLGFEDLAMYAILRTDRRPS